jgi:hypothetical protein
MKSLVDDRVLASPPREAACPPDDGLPGPQVQALKAQFMRAPPKLVASTNLLFKGRKSEAPDRQMLRTALLPGTEMGCLT